MRPCHLAVLALLTFAAAIGCAPEETPAPQAETQKTSPVFYRFADEFAGEPTEPARVALAGVQYRDVLHPGFSEPRNVVPGADGTLPLGDLIRADQIPDEARGFVVAAFDGERPVIERVAVDPGSDRRVFAERRVRLRDGSAPSPAEARTSVLVRPIFPDRYRSEPVTVPDDARLTFAIAVQRPVAWLSPAPARFKVYVERDESNDVIFDELLEPAGDAASDPYPWRERTIDVSRFTGKTVRFVFEATPERLDDIGEASRWQTAPLWGAPKLLGTTQEERDSRPNLILVSLDTLRADHLGVYGYARPTSPNIDAFAREAFVFEQCIAPSSWTTPSHASLFSGLNPNVHGAGLDPHGEGPGHIGDIHFTPLVDRAVTFTELLRRNGYLTAAFTEGGSLGGGLGFAQGFELYTDSEPRNHMRQGSVEDVFARGLDWLDTYGGQPFFLFLHTFELHQPYNPPNPFLDRFRIGEKTYVHQTVPQTKAEANEHMALYDGGIAYVDHVLGQFFDAVRRRGLLDNTTVLIVSDHGEEFLEHGGAYHARTLYEEVVHVPFILRLPGENPASGRVPDMINLSDGFATVLDFFDIEYSAPVDSQSVLSLIDADLTPQPFNRASIVGLTHSPRTGEVTVGHRTSQSKYIITGDAQAEGTVFWGLVQQSRQPNFEFGRTALAAVRGEAARTGVAEEWYDLAADPREQNDLAASAPGKVAASRDALEALIERFAQEAGAFGPSELDTRELTQDRIDELEAMGYLN